VEFAETPEPPYYVAVITVRRSQDDDGYEPAADEMWDLARLQPGFLGMEWVADQAKRTGITASYWSDGDAIAAWKAQVDHVAIQRLGRERWYDAYLVRIARVERDYRWARPRAL
jgi:heme-degrading monooxygenase HmoA